MNGQIAQAASAGTEVGRVFDAVLRSLEAFSARAVRVVRAPSLRGAAPSHADLAPLRDGALGVLAAHADLVTGSGFVGAPGLLADAPLSLDWWHVADSREPRPLVLDLDPSSTGFYDYTRHPWFRVPAETGGPYVHGPYVDFHGTDQYILTMSAPALDASAGPPAFLGVAGADLYVRRIEKAVLPLLPPGAVLLNAQGRVIVSRSARHVTGVLLRDLALEDVRACETGEAARVGPWAAARCGRLRLYLLTRLPAHPPGDG
ncbi:MULTISPECIES: cache domain-containing protein [Actinomadura]|uniref:Cache domain-containing protein n=1 Tax=Actinomadura yumaensis TaxID=111807 RepID=A0ABW2CVY9_9ACTN|nr:cache domain-containing protein [Actinomadura sp. J1-007]MWK39659.1 hypothetical protein [Actinomadura sp. J1-007]